MSAFAKFRVQGADAESVLNWVSANDVAVTPGRTVYTQWLNHRGGIEADLTVTRLANDDYIIITAAGSQVRDFQWLKAHIPTKARCVITDVTSGIAVFAVMGPRSREFLQPLTTADLSNEGFPFGASLDIEIGYANVRATRITYVGELGWEIYVPSEMALHVYEILTEKPIVHVGMHAVNSLRIEKAYRHWGHDISGEDNPLEAGLGFAISWNKPGGFLGKDALIPRYDGLLKKRLIQFQLKDPKPLLYHNEPVYIQDKIIGYITSGMYGHHLGGAIGLGYISDNAGIDENYINNNPFEIVVAGKMEPAKGSIRPLYDPKSKRIRA